MHTQVISQLWGVGTAIVLSATVSYVALKLIDMTIGLRVKPDAEREGLDISEHGEQAYYK
jgi:Amt family ammonium transporter